MLDPDPDSDSGTGMVDPRTIQPGPEEVQFEPDVPLSDPANLDPDAGSSAAEEPRPDDGARGLVDPRAEIPGPDGP